MLGLPIRMKEVYLSNQLWLCKNASTQGWLDFSKRSKTCTSWGAEFVPLSTRLGNTCKALWSIEQSARNLQNLFSNMIREPKGKVYLRAYFDILWHWNSATCWARHVLAMVEEHLAITSGGNTIRLWDETFLGLNNHSHDRLWYSKLSHRWRWVMLSSQQELHIHEPEYSACCWNTCENVVLECPGMWQVSVCLNFSFLSV